MNEIIYLEPDSEITSVIDRIKKAESDSVVLVIPRGATLAQSIVNLKLLKKTAEGLGKEISLVTNDRISRNLGSQIGITVYSRVSEAGRAKVPEKRDDSKQKDDPEDEGSFKVNNYYRNKEKEEETEAADVTPVADAGDVDSVDAFDDDYSEDVGKRSSNSSEDNYDDGYVPASDQEDKESKDYDKDYDEDEEEPKYETKKIPAAQYKKTNLKHTRKPIIILSSVFLVVLLIASFVFLPYASASVQIKPEDYTTDISIVADKTATANDTNKLTIPATTTEIEKDLSKDFDSTGTKDTGTKATGTVDIYNYTDSAVTLPAGTRIAYGDKSFTTDSVVTLPKLTIATVLTDCKSTGNGTYECKVPGLKSGVAVTASSTGESYNLSPASPFSVAGFATSKIYAESKTAFSGGTTKMIKIISQSDLDKASASIKSELTASAKKELTDQVTKNNLTTTGSEVKVEVSSETSTKKADEESDTFNYSVKEKLYVLGFSESELKKLIDDAVINKVGDNKMILDPEESDISYKVTSSDIDAGTIKISASFKGKIGSKLDSNSIKISIKNKSLSRATEIIKSNENVENVSITTWPKFYKRIPMLVNRIKISFDYAK